MNLLLTKSQEYSAASNYRSVQNNATPDTGKLSGHMLNNFDQASQNPALDFIESIQQVSQRLLDSLVQNDNRFIEADDDQKAIFSDSLSKIKDIIEAMRESQTEQSVDDIMPTSAPVSEGDQT
jgi:hypothetical protein